MPGTLGGWLDDALRVGRVVRPRGSESLRSGAMADAAEPIHIPGVPEGGERIVRPALFVLFRIAVGPSADYYSARFLAFERAGRGGIGWHWPALFAPAVWAFYRKLWVSGLVFALLPLAGAVVTDALAPWFDESTLVWLAAAALLTFVLPGIAGASLANALLYRRVRRHIRVAEAESDSASQVASRVAGGMPVAPQAAMAMAGLALACLVGAVAPVLVKQSNPAQRVQFDGVTPVRFTRQRCKAIGCSPEVAAQAARGLAPAPERDDGPSLSGDDPAVARLIATLR